MVNSRSDSGSDSFVLAKAKKPVYEASMSKESDKTQELSCVVQVQEKVHTLASQTAVKAKDFTAETKSTLSVDAEELKYHQVQQPRVTKRKTAIECQSKPINMKLQKVKLVKVKLRRWREEEEARINIFTLNLTRQQLIGGILKLKTENENSKL